MLRIRVLKLIKVLLFVTGMAGSGWLVLQELQHSHTCPQIVGIPACIIILVCFIVPFIVLLLGKYDLIYFLFAGLALSIATVASFLQLIGQGECPKTGGDTPMCYYSLLLFSLLIILKIYRNKLIIRSRD